MKKTAVILLSILINFLPLLAEEAVKSAPRKERPTVGLVLSGGGAKGMAHIGALKVIEELGIPIDYVVGTSIGSIIGGIYALGYNADELDSLVRAQNWDVLMKDQVARRDVSYSYKRDNDRYIVAIPFMNHRNLTEETEARPSSQSDLLRQMPSALVSGQNLDQLFTKLSVGYQDDIDFNTLPIPFACVAVDLNSKEEVVFHRGDIVTAIRSSMSIPGYFAPVKLGDRYLIDGGMLNNLPVDVAKDMGADYVITIDLHHYKKQRPDNNQTIPEMVASMLSIMNGEKYHSGIASSDIVISPNTSAYGVLSFDEASVDALVDSGRVAAMAVSPQLRSLAEHLKTFPERSRQRPPKAVNLDRDSVTISQLEIRGTDGKEMAWLLSKTDIAPGKTITGEDMDRTMAFIYNSRSFRKATYDIAGKEEEGYRLKIELDPQRVHQASLGFRFDSEEMASLLLGMSLNKRKLFGPKLDLDLELGLNANATLRYGYTFRNLTRLNVAASLHHLNMDVYDVLQTADDATKYRYALAYNDQYNIFRAEADYQVTGWRNADIHFGIGYDNYRLLFTYNVDDVQHSDYIDNHVARSFVTWQFDNMDDSYFPTRGVKVNLQGVAYNDLGAGFLDKYSVFYEGRADFHATIPFGRRVTFIPRTWNRWLFGSPIRYYRNHVGGTMEGRYIFSQMPFVGINHDYRALDRVDILRADLRVNLFKQHYLTFTGNYMLEWESGNHARHLGFGTAYSLNTIAGPIQFLVHWSTLSRQVGVYFSLGYDF